MVAISVAHGDQLANFIQRARNELLSAKTWVDERARAAKLVPPDRAEKERLTKIYRPKIDEALKKMFLEIRRVEIIPGGKDALKEIRGVLSKDEK